MQMMEGWLQSSHLHSMLGAHLLAVTGGISCTSVCCEGPLALHLLYPLKARMRLELWMAAVTREDHAKRENILLPPLPTNPRLSLRRYASISLRLAGLLRP